MIAENFDDVFSDIDINKLPTLPHVLLVFLDAAHTEAVSFEKLSDLIKKDASLCARILTVANSAHYGGQGKFLSFERVLVLLGMQTIKTIAITASVQQFFSRFDSASVRRQKAFWRDSLTCAQLASSLARLTGYACEEEAYLAGLIHNIGSLIFSNNYPEKYATLADMAESEVQLAAFESEHFGGSRYQAGAWIVSSWDMESFVADAVLYQDEALESLHGAHHLVKILAVASRLSQCQAGVDEKGLDYAQQLFDLSEPLVTDLVIKTRSNVRDIAASMDIDLEPLAADSDDQISAIDESKQVELAGNVRDIALLNGIRQDLSRNSDEQSVKQAIQKSLRILFNAQGCLFFKVSSHGGSLIGEPLVGIDQKISEFDVPMVPGGCLLARCFIEKRVLHSLTADAALPPSVVDRQLIKLAGGQSIVCLPLMLDQYQLGVLVVGMATRSAEAIERQLLLWKMFANEASCSLIAQQQCVQVSEENHAQERELYRTRAREIAHEVNNPLSIVKNYVHILSSRLDEKDVAQEELQIIREELERAGSILLRLPGITEQHVVASGAEMVNVNAQISDLLMIFSASLFASSGIEAKTDLDNNLLPILTNRNTIKQILTNLIKNAAEALPEQGCITLETQGQVNVNGRNYVEIVISDNGPGIAADVQEKLFSPVQTTKGGAHAGLGLSIVKSLVDELDGSISCRSGAKNGTRFEILIPRITDDN